MSTCSKCKCQTKYCGCSDTGIPAAPPCTQGTADCPDPEPCAEIFATQCIMYNGQDIPELGISHGDRMDRVIQRFGLFLLNAGCINPWVSPGVENTCVAVVGLRTTKVLATTVDLTWDASPTADDYTVQVSTDEGVTWNSYSPNISGTTITASGLTTTTTYWFRVMTNCTAGGPCASLAIEVTTL